MKIVLIIAALLLASCRDDVAALPDPVAITADSIAHFCKMAIKEMPGPKAQVFLEGSPEPLFFAQVRDGVAYLKSPEKTAPILAIYVSDMGRAPSWDQPGVDNWTDARTAFFVVGADVTGGMGAPELAPFSDRDAALAFVARHGGAVMGLDAIPDSAVLAPISAPTMAPMEMPTDKMPNSKMPSSKMPNSEMPSSKMPSSKMPNSKMPSNNGN